MRKIYLHLFFCLPLSAFAQKSPIKFGDIPMEDMKMEVYPNDSSTEAVVLCDYGRLDFYTFRRHTRVKILKKEGLNRANVQQLILSNGNLKIVKASTFNLENGKIVETELTNKGIFEREFNKNYKLATFTMPSVKEGSVIEYIYETSFAPLVWRFQSGIPTRWSEYWAILPHTVTARKYMQGYLTVSSYEEKGINRYHWIIKDVPAFREEPFMTSEEDYVSKVVIVLDFMYEANATRLSTTTFINTWEGINEWLPNHKDFGQLITGSGFLKSLVSQITIGIDDPTLKIKALTDYVKQNFEWNGDKEFWGSPLKNVVEKKRGSSGELNLLLSSMLDKAGLDVDMVLLSTRDHGFIRKSYPSIRQLNYCICSVKIGDKTLLLDATDRYLPYNVLPSYCLNGEGLVISKKDSGWINLSPTVKDKTFVETQATLSKEGAMDVKLNYVHDGYDAARARKDFFSKGEDAYSKTILNEKNWTVKKKEFTDMEDNSKSAKSTYEIVVDEHAVANGDAIFLTPFITSTIENPFKSETRTYPIEFGSQIEKTSVIKITIPENYIVDELPQGVVFLLPENSARFTYEVTPLGNTISITCGFRINKSLFTQLEYPKLREFYSRVVAKQAEQIVLKKK